MGGDQQQIKIPDYKIYKVADCPELEAVEKALKVKGLTDPWLRNEVWRFNKKHFPGDFYNLRKCIFGGFKYGLGAAVVTVILGALLEDDGPAEPPQCYPPCPE